MSKQPGDLRLAGFLTLELREHGQRVGFEAVGLSGGRAVLAHVRSRSLIRLGRYGVHPEHLVPLIEEELVRPPETVNAFLIDEIGKMECLCPRFVSSMRTLLGAQVPVVSAIALRGGGFIAEVKGRPDVNLFEVTHGNRQTLPEQVAAWVKKRASRPNTL
jgi:nucleoside-triphosphatase